MIDRPWIKFANQWERVDLPLGSGNCLCDLVYSVKLVAAAPSKLA